MPVKTLFSILKGVTGSVCIRMAFRASRLFSGVFAKSRSEGGQNG